MNINNYLNQLQEAEIKDLLNIPKEKIKKSLVDLKAAFNSKDINKIKSLTKSVPKVEFDKIEKFTKEKIKNFNNLYSLAKKILINSLNVKENEKGIKELAALIAITASMNKDPKSKLKELLKKAVKLSKNVIILDIVKFILSVGALVLTSELIHGLSFEVIPVVVIYFIVVHLIYKYI